MSTVILAEKPSQALAYASALKQSTKKDGYFEIKDPLFTDETFITFGFGHLVELAEPGHYDEKWQNWKLESLPIFPDRYDFGFCCKVSKRSLVFQDDSYLSRDS
ncbi:TPA: hypothetical protein ACGOZ5_001932 [Streptococcus suis]